MENDVVKHVSDLMNRAEYEPCVSKFLTPQECIIVRKELKNPSNLFFWGGCLGCERKCAVILPEWYMPDNLSGDNALREKELGQFFMTDTGKEVYESLPIKAVKVQGSGFRNLKHKDFMGSVLSLGIERNMLGDIVVLNTSEALIFAYDNIADYIVSELKLIGRDGVKCSKTSVEPVSEIEREYEDIIINVMSMRLDGVVNQLTGEGRTTSAEMIIKGLVEHNYFVCDNVSELLKTGDIVSIRGWGKCIIGEANGNTKSGRIRLKCRKYK